MLEGRALLLGLTSLIGQVATSGCVAQVGSDFDSVPIKTGPVLADPYPERRQSFPGHVTALADVIYSAPAGFRPLRLDLYYPTTKAGLHPLVVYVHGGGWREGHPRQAGAFADWPGVLALLAARGYVVASVEYRLSGEAQFPAAIQDVKAAIRWLRVHAAEYGIDPVRVLAWGSSAGGQLAALAGASCDVAALAPDSSRDPNMTHPGDCVQGVIAWYGIFDFAALAQSRGTGPLEIRDDERSPVSAYLGCELSSCEREVLAAASVTTYIDSCDPPVLLIHGDADTVVPIQQSRDFAARLRSRGVPAQLIEIPGIGHSFVGANLSETEQASRQALAASIEFIQRILPTRGSDAAALGDFEEIK